MIDSSVLLARPARVAATMVAMAVLLYGCGAPERLPSDLSIETSKDVLSERVIAPIKALDDEETADTFEPLPRRKLIQVRHSPDSLKDQYFVSTLSKLLSYDPIDDLDKTASVTNATALSDEERTKIASQRALERTQILVAKGLEFEDTILTTLRDIDSDIDDGLGKTVSGLGTTVLPIFGRNLTGSGDAYLELPNDLIFIGGENGLISSKTALLKRMLDNPEIAFAVRDMPLSEALSFLFGSIGLQATMSEGVLDLDKTVTMSVQASAIAIIDSLLEQHELSIVFDPAIEVAQVYTQTQFDARLTEIKGSIEAYNAVLRDRKALERVREDRERVMEMLGYVQLLLSGDDEGFTIGMDSISRAPAGEDTSTLISDITQKAIDLRALIVSFDSTTQTKLSGEHEFAALSGMTDIIGRPDIKDILSEDSCIWPRQEIFTEKVAVYNAVIIEGDDTDSGVVGKINNFFSQTRPNADAPAATGEDDEEVTTPATNTPSYCGTQNPAPPVPIILPDDTGITVIGTREDNDLVVRLVEQYDVPELQVLIEIFLITVSRDFSRQIDSILSASPAAGGNNNQEVTLSQVARAASDAISTTGGSFALDLDSPNDELGLLLNFLESNALGRVISSPTILVAAGQDATIKRDQIARVPGPAILDADNNTVAGQPVEYNAPFELKIKDVDINRLNNTVKLDVELTDTRFNVTLANVNELSDRTSDVIDTTFWASPGDVVVLAGLTRNEESTKTSGAPGTTGDLAPLSPLLGGSDAFSTNLSETLIFMAPTVIDPSAENQPHSAFRKRQRRSIVN